MKTQTKKIDIVREVIAIIEQCETDGMEFCIPMQVSSYLKDKYDYAKGDALTLLEGVYLIQELNLL